MFIILLCISYKTYLSIKDGLENKVIVPSQLVTTISPVFDD